MPKVKKSARCTSCQNPLARKGDRCPCRDLIPLLAKIHRPFVPDRRSAGKREAIHRARVAEISRMKL